MCLLQGARAGDGPVPEGWGDRSGGTVSLGWGDRSGGTVSLGWGDWSTGPVPPRWGDRSGGTVSLEWGGTIACSMAKPISAKEGEIPEVMSIKEDKCRSHRVELAEESQLALHEST